MDCRTAHTRLIGAGELQPDEYQAHQDHLAVCAACRDDQDDPFSRALVQTTRELALPPPDFTAKLMQRLPAEPPLTLAQQSAQRVQRRWQQIGLAVAAGLSIAVVAGISLQHLWAGTTLGLAADVVLTVAGAAIGPLVTLLGSAVVVTLLLNGVMRRPSVGRALGSAALAALLLLSGGMVTAMNDAANAAASFAQESTIATVLQPIRVTQAIDGDVASLLGTIVVDGLVRGNVASVAGTVTLAPAARVGGDVLAGIGQIQAAPEQVVGAIRSSTGTLAVGTGWFGASGATVTPNVVRSLSALFGALVTLALAGLAVLLWPQRTLRASHVLPRQPWAALGIGVLITVLLVLLTLPVLALLAATVVGLLLVPLLLLAAHLPYVQGLAAVGQALGYRLTGGATVASALWGVAAQLIVVIGLGIWTPFAGLLTFYLLASLGLGADLLARRLLP
ncbi:MAG: polymer-forming cytoskeletal protein [Chloroflexota bacterium]|nr:polymer-forming cytoskeletal protein [Chloroflexota bacterium]